ncbi:uncharacterized protein VTP21DRAFT_10503 [Calcarisporiella thermophila]|uniref:uncharacterized protein n=1 Tax=Calcarisporiella thermophila TaxID=911321 RepID=UPI003743EDC0
MSGHTFPATPNRGWIKQRILAIQKTSGIDFNEDIFISIFLCLIASEKHVILTASEDKVEELKKITEQIAQFVFGLTCTTITCDPTQSPSDFIGSLCVRPREDSFGQFNTRVQQQKSARSLRTTDSMHSGQSSGSRVSVGREDAPWYSESSTQALMEPEDIEFIQTEELNEFEDPRYPSSARQRHRNSLLSAPIVRRTSAREVPRSPVSAAAPPPVTPVDFTFVGRRHDNLAIAPSHYPADGVGAKRLAQAVVLERLEDANELVHAALLEMLVRRQVVTDRLALYNLPRPFIIIAILPYSSLQRPRLPSHLIDRFFISYAYDGLGGLPESGGGGFKAVQSRRNPFFRSTEIEELSRRAQLVTINNDMMRYIRDFIVGLRTHRAVRGGVTSRSSQDLVLAIRSISAILQYSYATPEFLLIAAEKVFSHRLIITRPHDRLHPARVHIPKEHPSIGLRPPAPHGWREDEADEDEREHRDGGERGNGKEKEVTWGLSTTRRMEAEEHERYPLRSLSATPTPPRRPSRLGHLFMDLEAVLTAADIVADVLQVVWPPV